MQDFRNLKVWQKAHAPTLAVYQVTTRFPGDERFGLTVQLRRTSTDIPTTISDGCGRGTDAEFLKCLFQAMGGGNRSEYLLLLSHDLGFLPGPEHQRLTTDVIEVKRMIAGLIHSLNG